MRVSYVPGLESAPTTYKRIRQHCFCPGVAQGEMKKGKSNNQDVCRLFGVTEKGHLPRLVAGEGAWNGLLGRNLGEDV